MIGGVVGLKALRWRAIQLCSRSRAFLLDRCRASNIARAPILSRPVPVVEHGTPGCAARLLARARIGSRLPGVFLPDTVTRGLGPYPVRTRTIWWFPRSAGSWLLKPAAERVDRECYDKSEGCSESRGRRPWCFRGSQDGLDSRPSGRPHPFRWPEL